MVKVSVIITYHYANAPFIAETIKSLSNQVFKDFELILIAQDPLPELQFDNISIVVYRWKPEENDRGLTAKARNIGIDGARGEYIKILDSDDILYPDYLKTCVDILDRFSDIGLVYTDYLINKNGCLTLKEAPEFDFDTFLTWNFIGCSTVMYRKSDLRFNERMTHWEDYEFWLRLLVDRYKFKRVPTALVEWRDHPAQTSKHVNNVELETVIIEGFKKLLRG